MLNKTEQTHLPGIPFVKKHYSQIDCIIHNAGFLVNKPFESISVSELQTIADDMKARDPEEALKFKMVDRLVYYDEVLATLKTKTGKTQKQNISSVELGKYIKSVVKVDTYTASKIAVIYASGDIVSGSGQTR